METKLPFIPDIENIIRNYSKYKFYYENGDLKYEGDFANKTINGKGKWYRQIKSENNKNRIVDHYLSYDGEFKDGIPHGKGIVYYSKHNYYSGEFKDGIPHGKGGTMIMTKNKEYRGEFVNGLPHGIGELKDNNFYYTGEFVNGYANGRGYSWFVSNGKWWFPKHGEFKDGSLVTKDGEESSVCFSVQRIQSFRSY